MVCWGIMGYKFVVAGAGGMGKAIIRYLVDQDETEKVFVFDADKKRVTEIAKELGEQVVGFQSDFTAPINDHVFRIACLRSDVLVGAASYKNNSTLTQFAIAHDLSMVDLGGNHDVVLEQHTYHTAAIDAGVTIIPDCGLAPGLANIIAAHAIAEFDEVYKLEIRVGGLPQEPRGLLGYKGVFSEDGLVNEYCGLADVLRNKKHERVATLDDVEMIYFDGLEGLEAFTTSGGTGTMCETLAEGKVQSLDYKTIRWNGHLNALRGFYSETDGVRTFDRERLAEAIDQPGEDMVLLRVDATGFMGGEFKRVRYDVVERARDGLTAMQLMTATPAAITAYGIAEEFFNKSGVLKNEVDVAAKFGYVRCKLEERGIMIMRKVA
jgi:lysine 6-dehydrogenase